MITEMELDEKNYRNVERELYYENLMEALWKLDNNDDIDFEDENAERIPNDDYWEDYDRFMGKEASFEYEEEERFYEEASFEDEEEERFYDNDTNFEDEHEERFYDYYMDFLDERGEIYYDEVMDFENKHVGFYEDDLDFEAELEERLEHETAVLALLRGQNLVVYNSDGTLRCPLSPSRKKQTYSYKDLLQHATAVASGKLGPEAAGKHKALKTFLEPKLLSQRFLKVEQNLPPRRQAEDMLVCPWSVVIYNIDKSTLDWARPETCDGLQKSALQLYFADFNPVQVEVYKGSQYQPGACVLEFGRDLSGLKDAQALERSFIDQEHGLRDCERRQDSEDLGENVFGWLAREADYYGQRCGRQGEEIGQYLRKVGNLKDIEMVGDELKCKRDRQVRQLAATVSEKSKESQDLKTDMEKNRRRAEAERLQLEESLKLARFGLQQSILVAAAEKKRLQAQMLENRQLREALANQQVLLQHKEAEKMRLLQKHEEETLRLVEHARKEALRLAKRQQIEMEREQLQTMHQTGKLFKTIKEDLGQKSKKMEELEKKLAELQSTQEYQEDTITTLTVKERESNDELVDGREMAVEVIQYVNEAKQLIEAALKKKEQIDKTKQPQEVKFKQPQPKVEVKRAGAIDDTTWSRAFKRKYKNDGDWGIKMTEVFSSWEARIRNPEFQPFKTVQIGEEKWEQQIDDENKELASLKKTYGKEVYNSVITALMEIEEYNASGRYPVPLAWNFKKSRKASLKEVIQYQGRIIDSLVAPEVFAYLGKTIESLMGPGASRKRYRN